MAKIRDERAIKLRPSQKGKMTRPPNTLNGKGCCRFLQHVTKAPVEWSGDEKFPPGLKSAPNTNTNMEKLYPRGKTTNTQTERETCSG